MYNTARCCGADAGRISATADSPVPVTEAHRTHVGSAKREGVTRFGEAGHAFCAFFGGLPPAQGFAGASAGVVRSDGRRREGSGRSGEVCVWTIFQSAPTFW